MVWGLDPPREAHMRKEALASIREVGSELMGCFQIWKAAVFGVVLACRLWSKVVLERIDTGTEFQHIGGLPRSGEPSE